MKKVRELLLISAFFITIFASGSSAEYISHQQGSVSEHLFIFQRLDHGAFFTFGGWYSIDSFIAPVAGSTCSHHEGFSIEPNYFQEFDYVPDINVKLLEPAHKENHFSVKAEEDAKFSVQYCDAYGNAISSGYPVLIITHPNSSTTTHNLDYDGINGLYSVNLDLPKGTYGYKYIATNSEYSDVKGLYEVSGIWYVTSRPYNFVKRTPIEGVEVLPDDANFSWTVNSDESNDIFTYEFFIGKNADKNSLEKIDPGNAHTSPSGANAFVMRGLDHIKQYYWYMIITNKHGASLETDLFTFYTGGMVEKFYNAPNPFNPARGQSTKFVFGMPQEGTAKIVIYSEYGDKVWESETVRSAGNTSKEITYNGKDNSGRTLYNGTYLAILTKKYAGKTKTEKCRILIVK